jgi:hypothetical protein
MFVVEDGTGKADATSYADIETADVYMQAWHGGDDQWFEQSDHEKKACLMKGTRFIDSHDFRGFRLRGNQALQFPRLDMETSPMFGVPEAVVHAAIEAAFRVAKGEDLLPDHSQEVISGTTQTIGPITTQVNFARGKKPARTYETIHALLRPYVVSKTSRQINRSF